MLRPLLFGFAAVFGVGLALGPQTASAGGLPCGHGARCDIGPAYRHHHHGPYARPVYWHRHHHHHHFGYYGRAAMPFYGPTPVEEYGPPVPAYRPVPVREAGYYPVPPYRTYHAYRAYAPACGGLLCGLFCGF